MFKEKYKIFVKNWLYAFLMPRPIVGLFYVFRYFKHYRQYKYLASNEYVELINAHPCLLDWAVTTPFDGHYFYQGAWLARKLRKDNVDLHMDVGSSVMMVSVLSAMVKTIFVDYRPLKSDLSNLSCVGANITQLPFNDASISSLSCQHVIEHIGLGRYGDPIDPDGSIKAAKELERILKPDGKLYLSLPVGKEKVCFNAHRVHDPSTVTSLFNKLELVEFSFVNDNGEFFENRDLNEAKDSNYACGMYVFIKK